MTALPDKEIDIKAIRNLYAEKPAAKLAFDDFAARRRNQKETKVDRLHAVLAGKEGSRVSYGDVRNFLQELAKLNCGEYRIGRRGKPSRFVWRVGLASLGQAAASTRANVEELNADEAVDETDAAEEPEAAPPRTETSDIRVIYPLRLDRHIEFLIPKDLTTREAQRLSDFIKTLPFDAPGSA
jgi:hypothetical protein